MKIREAVYALRVVRRRDGLAGIIYRRRLNDAGEERLDRIAAIGTLAFAAGVPLLRSAVRSIETSEQGANEREAGADALSAGPFHPLDADWGARVACFALVASGLRDGERLRQAAGFIQHLDGTEAAWWIGLLADGERKRAVRALRILTEAVE